MSCTYQAEKYIETPYFYVKFFFSSGLKMMKNLYVIHFIYEWNVLDFFNVIAFFMSFNINCFV